MQYLSQFAVIYLVHSLHWKIAPFSLLDYPWLLAVGLFLAIFMTQELGYRLSQRTRATILLPLIFAAVISLIADLDAPNSGLIRAGREITTRLQQDLHRER